jgi:hypothetical protein
VVVVVVVVVVVCVGVVMKPLLGFSFESSVPIFVVCVSNVF